MSKGDVVHIHNSFTIKTDDLEGNTYVPHDSFAEVISINEDIAPIKQPLKGRENPVTISLMKVQVKLLDDLNSKVLPPFLCLKDYLYAEKPEIDQETLLALYVNAKVRFQRSKAKENKKDDETIEFAQFLREDPWFNAARLRFGYALTLHRAQGRQFSTIIGNLDTDQGQDNDSYFRWVYTLLSIVKDKVFLLNIPSITPFDKVSWDGSQAKIDTVRPRNIIPFDPNSESGNQKIPNLDIPNKELRNLYLYLDSCLKPKGIISQPNKHHKYQEIYDFHKESNTSSCTLRLYYNGKYQVTRIETIKSNPAEFAIQVQEAITSGIQFETDFQQQLYHFVKEKLDFHQIRIKGIEHHNFQEIYYLNSASGEVRLQIFYDGDGFAKKIMPLSYTDPRILDEVRSALEL